MNKKKNQLFRIIAALRPSEKAYLKKFGYKQEKQDSIVIYLFDLIDKQMKAAGDFVEEKLISSFGKKFPKQNYTKVKSRLLEQVLDALRDYDKKHNEVEKIYDYLAYAESLKKRELFFDAWNILQRAEKLAEELELVELLIYIKTKKYYYEIFAQKYLAKHSDNETISNILADVETLKDRIDADFAAYRILHFQKSIGIPRSADDFELLKEIQSHPAFSATYAPALESTKLNLAVALSGIFFSVGDVQSVVRVAEKLINNYKAGEKLRRINSSKYLSLFDSFLQASLLSLNIPLYERYYPTFSTVTTYGEDDKNLKLGIDLYTRSIYAIVSGRLDLILGLTQEFNRVREKNYIPNYRKISLAYYMVFGPFLLQDYEQAFEQIQWIKNNRHLGLRYDIEVGILSMECIILIERKDFSLLEYRLRSFDAFLKSKERKFKIEAKVVQLIRNTLACMDNTDLEKVYTKSYAEMRAIVANNPAENAFLQAFDIISWLEGKIKQLSFRELYYKNNIESGE